MWVLMKWRAGLLLLGHLLFLRISQVLSALLPHFMNRVINDLFLGRACQCVV